VGRPKPPLLAFDILLGTVAIVVRVTSLEVCK
jgi:hypothetical protein